MTFSESFEAAKTVSTLTEPSLISERNFKFEARSEDEFSGPVDDQGVFESDGHIGPAFLVGKNGIGIEVDVTVLGGDERESLGDGIAKLERIDMHVTTLRDEIPVDLVIHEDRADQTDDRRVFKKDGIRNWLNAVGEPVGFDEFIAGFRGSAGVDVGEGQQGCGER